jgi:hypothetical protein
MKTTLIVLLGMPTSGKNVAGRCIRNYGVPFYPSFASVHPATSRLPWDRPPLYDHELLDSQVKRDEEILSLSPQINHVAVEGWHLEDFAYSSLRGNHLTDRYTEILRRQISKFELCVFYCSRTPEELIEYWADLSLRDKSRITEWYRSWLTIVTEVLRSYHLKEFNLSLDSPLQDDLVLQRIEYLLTEELMII